MAVKKMYAIKIDRVNLFYAGGGWNASPDDATKFNTPEEAKNKAVSLNKPGLVIVTMNVGENNDTW